MYVGYLNLGTEAKKYYDVTIRPQYIEFVPGYINDPNFLCVGYSEEVDTAREITWREDIFSKFCPFVRADCKVYVDWVDTPAEVSTIVVVASFGELSPATVITQVTISQSTDWRATISNMPVYDDEGEEIKYDASVVSVTPDPEYTVTKTAQDARHIVLSFTAPAAE